MFQQNRGSIRRMSYYTRSGQTVFLYPWNIGEGIQFGLDADASAWCLFKIGGQHLIGPRPCPPGRGLARRSALQPRPEDWYSNDEQE
jgi:hypothetical protein